MNAYNRGAGHFAQGRLAEARLDFLRAWRPGRSPSLEHLQYRLAETYHREFRWQSGWKS